MPSGYHKSKSKRLIFRSNWFETKLALLNESRLKKEAKL